MSLRDALSAPVRRAVRMWERVPIRVQGRITVGLPLLAVIISACLGISGNSRRGDIETGLQQRYQMTAALGDLSSSMVDAETGMRGYLLTGQEEFLQPFDKAALGLPASFDRLTVLASAEPDESRGGDLSRLAELRGLTTQQINDLAYQRTLLSTGRNAADPELRDHLRRGKQLMDRIRSDVGAMQATETTLVEARIADINAIRVRDYVSVAVALVAALATRFLAWFLFRRGILHRVQRLTLGLRDRRHGRPPTLPAPVKRDQMGELEHEVHLLDH